ARLCRATTKCGPGCHVEYTSHPLPVRGSLQQIVGGESGSAACQHPSTAITSPRSMEPACRENCQDFPSITRRWNVRRPRCCPRGSTPTSATAQGTETPSAPTSKPFLVL